MKDDFELIDSEIDDLIVVQRCSGRSLCSTMCSNDYENGQWRYSHFNDFVFDNIPHICLSEEEIENCQGKGLTITKLAAQKLRLSSEKDNGFGGEIAEILLDAAMRTFLKSKVLVPKIYLKQNNNDNVKGSDIMHISFTQDDFWIWLGEAKFYLDFKSAIADACKSIEAMLSESQLKTEKTIIISGQSRKLVIPEKHKDVFTKILGSRVTLDKFVDRIRVPIMLIYEQGYLNTTEDLQSATDQLREDLKAARDELEQRIKKTTCRYLKEIDIFFFIFPVPKKAHVVANYREYLDFLRK